MTKKEVLLTYEGLKKLEKELEDLKLKRLEVADRLKQALAYGDISENYEYDEAKNEQAQLEGRIAQLENMLKNAKIIDEDEVSTDFVNIGSKVKLLDLDYNETFEYHIVGSTEADPAKKKISNESPVGKELMGKKKGDTVTVNVPDGIVKFKILDIYK